MLRFAYYTGLKRRQTNSIIKRFSSALKEVENSPLANKDVLNLAQQSGCDLEDLFLNRIRLNVPDTRSTIEVLLNQLRNRGELSSKVLWKATMFYTYNVNSTDGEMADLVLQLDQVYHKNVGSRTIVDIQPHSPRENASKSALAHYFLQAHANNVKEHDVVEKVLSHAADAGDVDAAEQIFKLITVPSVTTFSSMIKVHAGVDLDRATGYFNQYLESLDNTPSSAPIVEYGKALVKAKKTEDAILFLMRDVPSFGVSLSINDLNALLLRIIAAGDLHDALEFYHMIRDDDVFPNPNSYTEALAITIHTFLNDFDAAFQLYSPLKTYGNIPGTPKILGWFGRACVANNQLELAMKLFPQSQGDLVLFVDILECHEAVYVFRTQNLCKWLSDSIDFVKRSCKSYALYTGLQRGFKAAARLAKAKDLPFLLSIHVRYKLYIKTSRFRLVELFKVLLSEKEKLPSMGYPEFCALGVTIASSSHSEKKNLLLKMIDWMDGLDMKPRSDLFSAVLKELNDSDTQRSWKLRMLNYLPETVVGKLPGREAEQLINQLMELIPVDYLQSVEMHRKLVTLPDVDVVKKATADFKLVEAAINRNDMETVQYLWDKSRKFQTRWLDVFVRSEKEIASELLEEIFRDYLKSNPNGYYDFLLCSKVLQKLINNKSFCFDSARGVCVELMEQSSFLPSPWILGKLFCENFDPQYGKILMTQALKGRQLLPRLFFNAALRDSVQKDLIREYWSHFQGTKQFSGNIDEQLRICSLFLQSVASVENESEFLSEILSCMVVELRTVPIRFSDIVSKIASVDGELAYSLVKKAKAIDPTFKPSQSVLNLIAKATSTDYLELLKEFDMPLITAEALRHEIATADEETAKSKIIQFLDAQFESGQLEIKAVDFAICALIDQGDLRMVMNVIEEVKGRNIALSTSTCNLIIKLLFKEGVSSDLEKVYDYLQAVGHRSEKYHFLLLFASYEKEGKCKPAMDLLKKLVNDGVASMDLFTICFSICGNDRSAFQEVLSLLQSSSINWDSALFNHVLELCLKSHTELGLRLYNEHKLLCNSESLEIMGEYAILN